jgi:hypothetical protein
VVSDEGELIGEMTLNPDKDYQAFRRPEGFCDSRIRVSTMSRHMTPVDLSGQLLNLSGPLDELMGRVNNEER